MSDEPKEPSTCRWEQETADYYLAEWSAERSCGWLVRDLAFRGGITVTEALLFLNWIERFTDTRLRREANELTRTYNEMLRELLPLQMRVLKKADEESECNDDWKQP